MSGDLRWFAVHSAAQKESLAARELRRRGFEVFFPYTSHWVDAGHKAKSRLVRRSWFPRYLFARTLKEHLWAVNDSMGVATVVRAPGGEPCSIPNLVMEMLLSLCDPLGEVLVSNVPKKRQKFKQNDVIVCTDDTDSMFKFRAAVKEALDNGTVHVLFLEGKLAGTDKMTIEDPSGWELVQGAA